MRILVVRVNSGFFFPSCTFVLFPNLGKSSFLDFFRNSLAYVFDAFFGQAIGALWIVSHLLSLLDQPIGAMLHAREAPCGRKYKFWYEPLAVAILLVHFCTFISCNDSTYLFRVRTDILRHLFVISLRIVGMEKRVRRHRLDVEKQGVSSDHHCSLSKSRMQSCVVTYLIEIQCLYTFLSRVEYC